MKNLLFFPLTESEISEHTYRYIPRGFTALEMIITFYLKLVAEGTLPIRRVESIRSTDFRFSDGARLSLLYLGYVGDANEATNTLCKVTLILPGTPQPFFFAVPIVEYSHTLAGLPRPLTGNSIPRPETEHFAKLLPRLREIAELWPQFGTLIGSKMDNPAEWPTADFQRRSWAEAIAKYFQLRY